MNEETRPLERRGFLTRLTALVGIGGLALASLIGRAAKPVRAADGDPLIIGASNTGTSVTTLTSNPSGVSGIPAFQVLNPGFDIAAIQGWATTTDGPSKGVVGRTNSGNGTGLFGFNTAVNGPAIAIAGVSLLSTNGIGVHGHPLAKTGNTIGVVGVCESPDGVGVQALNFLGGVGLEVFGRSRFTTILDGTIPAGADNAVVSDSQVNLNSEVLVMLAGDPGSVGLVLRLDGQDDHASGSAPFAPIRNGVSWISVGAGNFTVHLLGSAENDVPFRAFVVEKR